MSRITSFVAAGLLASVVTCFPFSELHNKRGFNTTTPHYNNTGMVYSYEDVPVSPHLHWVPCYDKFQCANLLVPLDYAEPSVGNTTIAFIRLPSANTTHKDILYNPGGPGGSGIDAFLSGMADNIVAISGGLYNAVSFDPRGVNNSGPALTCFPGNTTARDAFWAKAGTATDLTEVYAQMVALGHFCAEANEHTDAKYAGTSAVAQDLVHFTELQAAINGDTKPEEAEINYYGVSYGTVLGQTLAALYPGRIGRLILSANVNGEEFYNGVAKSGPEDADQAYDRFFKLCIEAGPEKCEFAGDSNSAEDLKFRFNALLERLQKNPAIVTSLPAGPEIITKNSLLADTFMAFYSPIGQWPQLAKGLANLDAGVIEGYVAARQAWSPPHNPGPRNYNTFAAREALIFITQNDAAGRYPAKNLDEYIKLATEIEKISVYAGPVYARTNGAINAGATIMPPKSQYFPGFKTTKTKNPILFINTAADQITPLSSAKHMSKYFEGSTVLVQDSAGHGIDGYPSTCTMGYVAKYWVTGSLPAPDTVCEPDVKPLVDTPALSKRDLSFTPVHLF